MTMGMTSRLLVAGLAACLLPVAASAQGKPGAAARITTGTVERADRTRLDSNATPGALVGGTLGLLSASGKSDGRKARNAIIGAGAGAMIANAAQGSRDGMVYTVRTGPSSSIRIVSDQSPRISSWRPPRRRPSILRSARSRFSATTEIFARCLQGATVHEGGSEC